MDNYSHSFQLFAYMMTNEIKNHPDPDDIWNYLKSIDHPMLEIEGDTFDGLYMYYKGRYLYSWDTPYSQYESTGYIATQRPWYKAAKAGNGEIVFTPPYMSYANHYILSTISQLQPDGETVFAYDIKMGDIQELVSNLQDFPKEQMMIFDKNGTIIGSSNELYLGSLHANGTIAPRLPLHGSPKMRHSATRLILSRLTMPRTGDWTAIRWNVSPPLILCIRHRTFSLLVLPEREKAIWPVPLDTKHAKGDSVPSMPMLRNCSVR